MRTTSRRTAGTLACGLAAGLGLAGAAGGALLDFPNAAGPLVLVGRDDDDRPDTTIQPPGVTADQTLRKGDQLVSGRRDDVLIGRLGPDSLTANDGDGVMVGGLERGSDAAASPSDK